MIRVLAGVPMVGIYNPCFQAMVSNWRYFNEGQEGQAWRQDMSSRYLEGVKQIILVISASSYNQKVTPFPQAAKTHQ